METRGFGPADRSVYQRFFDIRDRFSPVGFGRRGLAPPAAASAAAPCPLLLRLGAVGRLAVVTGLGSAELRIGGMDEDRRLGRFAVVACLRGDSDGGLLPPSAPTPRPSPRLLALRLLFNCAFLALGLRLLGFLCLRLLGNRLFGLGLRLRLRGASTSS